MTHSVSMAAAPLVIRKDDLSGDETRALVALHLAGMHESSPPEHVFALDVSGLQAPNVTFWSVWQGDDVVGIGALKVLDAGSAEIKSMRTHPRHLRKGVAAYLLDYVIMQARQSGLRRLSLETGRGDAFEPALALYRSRGFVNGEAFSDYLATKFNQFMHLML
ncbi:GNAT family N-acetyltransferase [Musicola paradisiaca]|uniref:GCN5-related N-acetyltransferase n=1 Tax=Musicola paradisiaca (strain Ech703) TaxID=579405 RepID=C6C3Z3_MUSP7|nr:GNAT family N-acetyltransferase [Musicola paradisiaca]ACS87320.1 GCN5-related N-acetyltransferase [Musicola paradisiaca Ech703]